MDELLAICQLVFLVRCSLILLEPRKDHSPFEEEHDRAQLTLQRRKLEPKRVRALEICFQHGRKYHLAKLRV